jgi:DNA-binding MarR family transcriptional regulator
LLHVPQHDLQAQLATRLERLGFPALRPALVQLLSAIGSGSGPAGSDAGVRLSDLVSEVSLPKQTVGDLLDELEEMRMVERFPDPDHGVIKRVRLGPKGKVWAAEVKRVSAATEARWATDGLEDALFARAARGAGGDRRGIAARAAPMAPGSTSAEPAAHSRGMARRR